VVKDNKHRREEPKTRERGEVASRTKRGHAIIITQAREYAQFVKSSPTAVQASSGSFRGTERGLMGARSIPDTMSNMLRWTAVSFGALDVRGTASFDEKYELLVTPTIPGPPLLLLGEGARLWRRLADGAVADDSLSGEESTTVREMEIAGIVSRQLSHPARTHGLSKPWMSSPMHELVYALLQCAADECGADIVFIKGPTLHAQDLRDREHSGDVDCWVRPGQEVRLAEAMSKWGWVPAYSPFTGTRVLHSLTLRAGEWGSAIDVHSWFPGMATRHVDAFAAVLASAETREFAGINGLAPSRDVHAIISALHDVRPVLGLRASRSQHERAAATLARAGEGVVETSKRLGSDFALTEALTSAFPELEGCFADSPEPEDWAWRSQTSPVRAYWEAFKLIPPSARAQTLLRVIWPTSHSLRSGPLGAAGLDSSTWRLRMRRLNHGVRMLVKTRRR
jgi:hypothetical protein